jgi:endonuclease/exonuclease/phosphatase family metal-dependent hydrolase
MMKKLITSLTLCLCALTLTAQRLTVVELNVENLFDTQHDTLKNDYEFLPDGSYHWTRTRYWRKLNRVGQTIIACGGAVGNERAKADMWSLPDLVGLCEVENDTVLRDLTKRSLLRKARYEYVMTDSPDARGIDVALLYSPFTFQLLHSYSLRVVPLKDMRPTRDILYAAGRLLNDDTLHVFVVHAPSRSGGEHATRPNRRLVAERLIGAVDSIRALSPDAHLLLMGDFNDYADSPALQLLEQHGLVNVSKGAQGSNGAKGTYRYQGDWGSLDQILTSRSLAQRVDTCIIYDAPFLLEKDTKYGGVKPKRNYLGPRYRNGFSDHLPLVLFL